MVSDDSLPRSLSEGERDRELGGRWGGGAMVSREVPGGSWSTGKWSEKEPEQETSCSGVQEHPEGQEEEGTGGEEGAV